MYPSTANASLELVPFATTMNVIRLKKNFPMGRTAIPSPFVEESAERLPGGSIVKVEDAAGKFVGWAFYNRHARVQLRLLSTKENDTIDDAFFYARLEAAWELRRLLFSDTVSYRLVHSEGDGLPGLVIDRYGDLFVVEFFSSGMFRQRKLIRRFLVEKIPEAVVYTFSQRHVQKQESFDHYEDPIPSPVIIEEHGLKFEIHPGTKQKTGFFLDQKDNRKRLGDLASGKSVLDLCCHAGGFALNAKARGATKVVGIDRDEEAIAQAKHNAQLNDLIVDCRVADVTEVLQREKEGFDIIVLDPPKQTRSKEGLGGAKYRYLEWNRLAMKRVNPGGHLITCSCTGLLKDEEFFELLFRALKQSGRTAELVRWSSASPDHPYCAEAPETHYLKVAWLKIT